MFSLDSNSLYQSLSDLKYGWSLATLNLDSLSYDRLDSCHGRIKSEEDKSEDVVNQ